MLKQSVKEKGAGNSANRVRKTCANAILDLVFPPRCAACHTWSTAVFCPKCRAKLRPVVAPFCACCGKPFDPLAKVLPESRCADCRENRYRRAPQLDARRAPFEYSGPIREAIHALKYNGKTALAAPLAQLLREYSGAQSSIPFESLSALVPIPLHPLRHWRRGYNQSTLLAHELSLLSGIPIAEILRRTRHTLPQIELDAAHRAANVRGAFTVDERAALEYSSAKYSSLENILLIDDVSTTGATLEECARILKQAGAQKVYALTLARRDL